MTCLSPLKLFYVSCGKDITVAITSIQIILQWSNASCNDFTKAFFQTSLNHCSSFATWFSCNKQLRALTMEILVYLQQTHNAEVKCIAHYLL